MKPKDSIAAKSEANLGNILQQQELQSVTESSRKSAGLKDNDESDVEDAYPDRKTRSRATTAMKGTEDPDKVWTAEEILADEELWRVTDSSEEESAEEEKKTSQNTAKPVSKAIEKPATVQAEK